MSEQSPDTARACEACGAATEPGYECPWCTGGFMDGTQVRKWRSFRFQMRRMSGTYQLLQSLIEEIIGRLEQLGCSAEAYEGKALVLRWVQSQPDTEERSRLAGELSAFQRRALDLIGKSIIVP